MEHLIFCLCASVVISHIYVFCDTSDFPAHCFQCADLSRRLGASRGREQVSVPCACPESGTDFSGRAVSEPPWLPRCGRRGRQTGARRCLRCATGLAQEPRPATGEAGAERRGSSADQGVVQRVWPGGRGERGAGTWCTVGVRVGAVAAAARVGCGTASGVAHGAVSVSRTLEPLCWARAASPPALKLHLWPMFLGPGVGNLHSSALQDSHFLFPVALRIPGFLF